MFSQSISTLQHLVGVLPNPQDAEPLEGVNTMDNEQLLAEIREANLTYLMLAQSLIRQDKATALFRLGLTEEAADLLAALSLAQVMKVASATCCCAASAWTTTSCGTC